MVWCIDLGIREIPLYGKGFQSWYALPTFKFHFGPLGLLYDSYYIMVYDPSPVWGGFDSYYDNRRVMLHCIYELPLVQL